MITRNDADKGQRMDESEVRGGMNGLRVYSWLNVQYTVQGLPRFLERNEDGLREDG